jgi:hypothetical protein
MNKPLQNQMKMNKTLQKQMMKVKVKVHYKTNKFKQVLVLLVKWIVFKLVDKLQAILGLNASLYVIVKKKIMTTTMMMIWIL